jgi:hypothetical protein
MKTHAVTYSGWLSRALLAALGIAGLSFVSSAGWLGAFSGSDADWRTVGSGAVVAVAAAAGTWCLSRARAEGRWRAALDRYVEQELAKGAPSPRGL